MLFAKPGKRLSLAGLHWLVEAEASPGQLPLGVPDR
jgi:hypothetical protein